MERTELTALMYAVLDGEATPEERAALDQQLAADPDARAEFARLGGLFERLATLPQPHPPEGLVAAVSAALPSRPNQLSAPSRVLEPNTGPRRPANPSKTNPWRDFMTASSLFSSRKTWIGAGVAAAAVIVVGQFGFGSYPSKEEVAGTVVPAERYRAPQAAAPAITLGDQSVAQLLQNDGFLRMIKDPQVRAMAMDPGFQAAAKALQANPEAAKAMLANTEAAKFLAANADAARAALSNAEAARAMAANAEAARALMANPEAAKFLSANPQAAKFVAANAEAAKFTAANAEAAKFVAANAEAARFMSANAEAAKALLQNAEMARFMSANPEAARFMAANAEAAKFAAAHAEAARFMSANPEAARFVAANAEAARLMMLNPDVARVAAMSPEAARFVMGHAEAARMLMANPEASRALMQSPQANISAMYQRLDSSK